jgi:hypothetical protein
VLEISFKNAGNVEMRLNLRVIGGGLWCFNIWRLGKTKEAIKDQKNNYKNEINICCSILFTCIFEIYLIIGMVTIVGSNFVFQFL